MITKFILLKVLLKDLLNKNQEGLLSLKLKIKKIIFKSILKFSKENFNNNKNIHPIKIKLFHKFKYLNKNYTYKISFYFFLLLQATNYKLSFK